MKQTHVPSLAGRARCPLADPGRLTLAADPGRPILPPWPGDHGRTRSAIRVALPEIFARRALHTPERADNTSFANSRASNGHRRGQADEPIPGGTVIAMEQAARQPGLRVHIRQWTAK